MDLFDSCETFLFVCFCLLQFVEGSFEKYLERLDDPKVSAFELMSAAGVLQILLLHLHTIDITTTRLYRNKFILPNAF